MFQGWKAQQWGSPTLGSPNRNKYQSSPSSCRTRHEVDDPLRSLQPSRPQYWPIPTVRSHRTSSIQRYHSYSNELANPNRATAKRTRNVQARTTSRYKLCSICIDVHVQVLHDRVVAKLAKLLSRWPIMVIQDGAEFCIRSISAGVS